MTAPSPPEPRRLALATLAAVLVAAMVLLVAVLPAEYGIDPTRLGAVTGFAKLSEAPAAPVVEEANETGPVALYEMRATWRLVALPLAEQTGRVTNADSEARITLPLQVPNLTSVTASLTWNDTDLIDGQPTEGDMLEISVRGPHGERSQLAQAKNEPGMPATASATLNLRSAPFPEEDATSGLSFSTAEDHSSMGNYTFVVRLYTAGGRDGSSERDPGQNWTLTVTGEAYELDVVKRAERDGDRIRITLSPGQAIEYKFAMAEGATMAYRWNASAPVYADLHADQADDPERVVSAKIATLAADEGTYTAPFEGRHGWFWHNQGETPVTLTLETTGDYTLLGAV